MKISVIIPIYNVQQYVEECLTSVVTQKRIDAEVECIIVNDCTPDRSMEIVRRFVDNYHGDVCFRLLNHEKNLGISATRNTGIRAATGDYVLFIDSDDYLFDNCFEVMMEALKQYPQADFIQMNNKNNNHNGTPYYDDSKYRVLQTKKERLGMFVRYGVLVNPWNRLIKRDLFVEANLYFKEGIIFEDFLWSYQLADAASQIVVMPQVTYYYRLNEGSIMHSRNRNMGLMIHSWDVILTTMLQMKKTIYGCLLLTIFSRLVEMKDMESNNEYPKDVIEARKKLQKKVLRSIFRSMRPLLMLFSLTIYKPFYGLYSFSIVRKHYHKIERIMLFIELSLDSMRW